MDVTQKIMQYQESYEEAVRAMNTLDKKGWTNFDGDEMFLYLELMKIKAFSKLAVEILSKEAIANHRIDEYIVGCN